MLLDWFESNSSADNAMSMDLPQNLSLLPVT